MTNVVNGRSDWGMIFSGPALSSTRRSRLSAAASSLRFAPCRLPPLRTEDSLLPLQFIATSAISQYIKLFAYFALNSAQNPKIARFPSIFLTRAAVAGGSRPILAKGKRPIEAGLGTAILLAPSLGSCIMKRRNEDYFAQSIAGVL